MTYALSTDNNLDQIEAGYVVALYPSIDVKTWTNTSGSTWTAPFPYGRFSTNNSMSVTVNGAPFGTKSYSNEVLTLTSYIGDPNNDVVIVNFGLFFAERDLYLKEYPVTVGASNFAHYDGRIISAPVFRKTASDSLFGFQPIQSSSLRLANADSALNLYMNASFNRKGIQVFQYFGEPETNANMRLIWQGVMSNVSLSDDTMTIVVRDNQSLFDSEFTPPTLNHTSTYTLSVFPNLDQRYLLAPVRTVIGYVEGLTCVNISYSATVSTTTNRTWAVGHAVSDPGAIATTILASPVPTTTRVYVSDPSALAVGDQFEFTDSVTFTQECSIITGIGVNYWDIQTVTNAPSPGNALRVKTNYVYVVKQSIRYRCIKDRDYTESTAGAGSNVFKIVFVNNFEATLGISALDPVNDRVLCSYSQSCANLTGLPATPYAEGTRHAVRSHVAHVIAYLIKKANSTAIIDSTSFTDYFNAYPDAYVGFSIPESTQANRETTKELIQKCLNSALGALTYGYSDSGITYYLRAIQPITSTEKTIESETIIEGSYQYEIDYNDIVSRVLVQYAFAENQDFRASNTNTLSVEFENSRAEALHGVIETKTQRTEFIEEQAASEFAEKLAYILQDPVAKLTVRTTIDAFGLDISSGVQVSRDSLPTTDFDGTIKSKDFSVLSIDRERTTVTLELDELRGVSAANDEGDW